MKRWIVGLAAVATLLVGVGQADAATLFTDEASFLGAAGPLNMESFEGLAATDPSPGDYQSVITSGFTLANSGATSDMDVWDEIVPNLIHPTDGEKGVVWYANAPSMSVTFTFGSPIGAFGVNIVDYGSPSNPSPLLFTTNTGDNGVAAVGPRPAGNDQFFGIITSEFTSIAFARTEQNDAMLFDEVYSGQVIPEPSTLIIWSLLATLGLTFGWWRRKRAA